MKKTTFLKFIGLFAAVRGYNIALLCIAQYLAAIFVLSQQPWRTVLTDVSLLMLVLAGALAIAGGYIINGFYDKGKDLINQPTRTMIDHLVSQNTKLTLYFLLNFLSVLVASYVSFKAVLFFSSYIFAMWLYSHRINKLLLWSNLTASVLAVIPFFAVCIYYRNVQTVIIVHAWLIYLLLFSKELTKDLRNIRGDFTHNYATLPVVYGIGYTKRLITFVLFCCLLPIYGLVVYFPIGHLSYFLLFTVAYLCFFVFLLWYYHSVQKYVWLHNMLKFILVAGVFSVLLNHC